jgi:hypothetical protein
MTAAYQVLLQSDAYATLCELDAWQNLHFVQALNAVGYAQIDISPGDAKIIAHSDTMVRLAVLRNGVLVFGGLILRVGWSVGQTAPVGDKYSLYALDHGVYAAWRITLPGAGNEYASYNDDLADALKDIVYNNLGLGADAARRFSDLSIEADDHDGPTVTLKTRYENVLSALQKHAQGQIDWRFVPGAAGCTFTTAAAWGLDRTLGNGVNLECVLTTDRENVLAASWTKDILSHRNYLYVAGQGEGINRTVVERSTAGDITLYKRREALIDARQLTLTASLQDRGDAALKEYAAIATMDALPVADCWKATYGATFDLGDKITLQSKRYQAFTYNGKIVALDVTVTPDGETVKPTLEAC